MSIIRKVTQDRTEQEGKEGVGAPVLERTRWAARRDVGPGRNETRYRFR